MFKLEFLANMDSVHWVIEKKHEINMKGNINWCLLILIEIDNNKEMVG